MKKKIIKKKKTKEKLIVVIILASGASQRFGSVKYLYPINNIPLIYWSLKPYIELYQKYKVLLIIVAGPHYDAIFELLNDKIEPFSSKKIKIIEESSIKTNWQNINQFIYPKKYNKNSIRHKTIKFKDPVSFRNIEFIKNNNFIDNIKILICKNENYEKGMFSSYKKGFNVILHLFNNINQLKKNIKSVIISLADMPLISNDIVIKLTNRFKSHFIDYSIPFFVQNKIKKGHPIALKLSFAMKILKLDDNITLREALKKGKMKFIKTDDIGVLIDIDEKDDLENLLKLKINNFNAGEEYGEKRK
ncbi:MAG: hypothetical protein ACK4YF_08840 [Exilispira sp.]